MRKSFFTAALCVLSGTVSSVGIVPWYGHLARSRSPTDFLVSRLEARVLTRSNLGEAFIEVNKRKIALEGVMKIRCVVNSLKSFVLCVILPEQTRSRPSFPASLPPVLDAFSATQDLAKTNLEECDRGHSRSAAEASSEEASFQADSGADKTLLAADRISLLL